MMFNHGSSRLTIADMAESTPLFFGKRHCRVRPGLTSVGVLLSPEEFILVLHELRLDQVNRADSQTDSLEMADECREKGVVRV